jgi:endonuclease-8
MPEGPSIVIAREELAPFSGKKILLASGNTKADLSQIQNKKVIAIRSWGKHLLICLPDIFIRIHLMMFGSYRINGTKPVQPRLSLKFSKGEVNFYNCSVRIEQGSPDDYYDWAADVMSDSWAPAKTKKSLLKFQASTIADALLNQEIFSGVGNIIKNEVLFRTRTHPLSRVGHIPSRKLTQIVNEARGYSFDFYEWKKVFQLRKHWLVYKKKTCPRCDLPLCRQYLGTTKRLTFFCSNCQIRYRKT